MRHLLCPVFLALLSCAPLFAQTPTAPPAAPATVAPADAIPPVATAVLDFQCSDDTLDKQGAEIATLLEADLSSSDHVLTVERQEIAKILSEQELGASGLVSADTAAKIGNLTGAQVLVTGRLFAVGNQFMVVTKIISTETSRVYGVTATLNDLDNLPAAMQELSGKIDSAIATHRDVLVVREETPDQRLQRWRALLGQRALPSVTVAISESSYGQPAIDPAAQTEIILHLQQLGFEVIDADQSHKKADLTLSGEAFSELGARHGNLVSSRGRLELKLLRTSTRELLWTDRETQIAVDVGDRSAGKAAIEKAADKLMDRLLPHLAK